MRNGKGRRQAGLERARMARSTLTELGLRTLLRTLKQPIDGGKGVLVQRLTAFLSDDREATSMLCP